MPAYTAAVERPENGFLCYRWSLTESIIARHSETISHKDSSWVVSSLRRKPGSLRVESSLLDVNGTLYGTTYRGGTYNDGTLFTVDTSGHVQVLHSFGYSYDGQLPIAGLIDVNGILYGTTASGGTEGAGTVYSITSNGIETVLHNFDEPDGYSLTSPLTDGNGTLYGTASDGGAYNSGVVFSMSTSGTINWEYSFYGPPDDGSKPYGRLLFKNGLLYGTTIEGGSIGGGVGYGTVFSISTAGTNEKVLHNFAGYPGDGTDPAAGLIGAKGLLYGTTSSGGTYGSGTLFNMTSSGTETVLHSFGAGSDGRTPWYGSLLYVKGSLYGTTWFGGHCKHNRARSFGKCGTIYKVGLDGSEQVVHYFYTPNGSQPWGGLIKVNGTLYGTTTAGGAYRGGTVFALKL